MQKVPNPNLPVVAGVSLRGKCPYLELFWSVFSRIRTRIIPNADTSYAVRVIQINFEHGNILVYDHLFSAIAI